MTTSDKWGVFFTAVWTSVIITFAGFMVFAIGVSVGSPERPPLEISSMNCETLKMEIERAEWKGVFACADPDPTQNGER